MACNRTWHSVPRSRRRASDSGTDRASCRSGPSRAGTFSSPGGGRSAASCARCPQPRSTSWPRAGDAGCTRMLKNERPTADDAWVGLASRYTLKTDPYSSHSVILDSLGEGHGRRLLDVGAADGLLSRRLTERGWKVTGLEADAVAARAGAERCERMVVSDLDTGLPPVPGTCYRV